MQHIPGHMVRYYSITEMHVRPKRAFPHQSEIVELFPFHEEALDVCVSYNIFSS
jgi:hypothetical protein